ncbi:MAG: S-layer homology domain-containing protein [Clostridiales bacterium]|nr:S-layer homology domain-containing protein [Clostridiales bacterium]
MKKLICASVISLIIAGTSVSSAFSDVSSKHWAKDAIDKMVDQGIISGYTDGTFQPSRNLSKIESLILLSKVAGVNKYSDAAIAFEKEYEEILKDYKTTYKKQVSYLLGVGVLTKEELPNLINADKLNTPISREEMAILITKILGKDEEVSKKSFVVLPFEDIADISADAKPYVEYVYNEAIMKGLTANKFSPKENVTRAQAAIILNIIVPKVNIVPNVKKDVIDSTTMSGTINSGKISAIDTILNTIEIDEDELYEYDEDTEIYIGGKLSTISNVKEEMEITSAKIVDGIIEKIELNGKAEEKDEKDDDNDEVKDAQGYIVAEVIGGTSKKLDIKLENGKEITIYPADENKIIDGETAEIIKLRKLEEGDKILVVGEYDGDEYYFTVLVKY